MYFSIAWLQFFQILHTYILWSRFGAIIEAIFRRMTWKITSDSEFFFLKVTVICTHAFYDLSPCFFGCNISGLYWIPCRPNPPCPITTYVRIVFYCPTSYPRYPIIPSHCCPCELFAIQSCQNPWRHVTTYESYCNYHLSMYFNPPNTWFDLKGTKSTKIQNYLL